MRRVVSIGDQLDDVIADSERRQCQLRRDPAGAVSVDEHRRADRDRQRLAQPIEQTSAAVAPVVGASTRRRSVRRKRRSLVGSSLLPVVGPRRKQDGTAATGSRPISASSTPSTGPSCRALSRRRTSYLQGATAFEVTTTRRWSSPVRIGRDYSRRSRRCRRSPSRRLHHRPPIRSRHRCRVRHRPRPTLQSRLRACTRPRHARRRVGSPEVVPSVTQSGDKRRRCNGGRPRGRGPPRIDRVSGRGREISATRAHLDTRSLHANLDRVELPIQLASRVVAK